MWGLVLAACFLLGCLATAVGLLIRARKRRSQLRSALASRRISWGAQVRWRGPSGSWGAGGTLVMSENGHLSWTPASAADLRLVPPCSWEPERVQLHRLSSRRDVTGLRYVECELLVDGVAYGRFGEFGAAGQLPERMLYRS